MRSIFGLLAIDKVESEIGTCDMYPLVLRGYILPSRFPVSAPVTPKCYSPLMGKTTDGQHARHQLVVW